MAKTFPLDIRELKYRRKVLGFTQTAVAEMASLSVTHYNRIEMGRNKPSTRSATRIAKVLGCDLIDLAPEEHRQMMREWEARQGTAVVLDMVPFLARAGEGEEGEGGEDDDYDDESSSWMVVYPDAETYEDANLTWPVVPVNRRPMVVAG
jgi:transcriptional regulator with XRE-family HTH domain